MKNMKNNSTEHLNKMGSIIHRFREKHDLTQKELARRLNTTQSAVARIESGDQNVSTAMLSKINETLGVNVFQIDSGSLTVKVKGGKKLKGKIRTRTSKNGAVGLLCASLLNKGKTTLRDVPRIEEVFRIIEVLESIGVEITWKNNDLTLEPPKRFSLSSVNEKAARKTRSIIMFLGSLIHHRSSFSLPLAGGCRLGKRNIEPHIFALEDLGAKIEENNGWYKVRSSGLKGGTVVLYESGDTVTENALMAAACIPEETTIKFASANYQVQEMCFFLKELGVEIEGIGTTTLKVRGVKEINKDISYSLSEDPVESMFFLAAAIVTDSSITIERCPIDFLELELLKLEKMGFKYKRSKEYLSNNGQTKLVNITTFRSNLKAIESKIEPRPYPGLNIDNLPFFAVIATQAEGQTLIHDWVYEERAIYYKELDRLGASTILADPHRIYISGKTLLQPNEVICPPALRPAAIILIGMLGAQGTSILRNIYSINRGYESIIERLNSLGASIEFQP
ncbi:MAG: helix-turn-helix domain-containing protein, partial [Patescibacteria group bacterium]